MVSITLLDRAQHRQQVPFMIFLFADDEEIIVLSAKEDVDNFRNMMVHFEHEQPTGLYID